MYRHASMKTLDDAYVHVGTSIDNVPVMNNQVIPEHHISFMDKEFHVEARCATDLYMSPLRVKTRL